MEIREDKITDVQLKYFELLTMAHEEGGEDRVLSIKERLEYFDKFVKALYDLEMNSFVSYHVGITDEQSIILEKATKLEGLLHFNYIASDYGYLYSQSVSRVFHQMRIAITEYFIENYQSLERNEIYNNIMALNRELNYLNVLNENENVKLYPDTVFSGFLNIILCQLYILTENYSDAFGSMMNASFFYGMLQERYSPIPDEKIDEFVNASLSAQNRERSLNYWKPRNAEKEQLKNKYLRIMREHGFIKYSDAAEYIHAKENSEKKKYRYIYDALRGADK